MTMNSSGESAAREQWIEELRDWLLNESEKRMSQAMGRRGSITSSRGASVAELRDAKRLAEKVMGHKLTHVTASVEENERYCDMQDSIAATLDAEARQLAEWGYAVADYAARLSGQACPTCGSSARNVRRNVCMGNADPWHITVPAAPFAAQRRNRVIKREELTNPASCMSRAKDDEMTFVLLGRDAAAPYAIRAWVEGRIHLRKNKRDDPQIIEALACADRMEADRVAAQGEQHEQSTRVE